MHKQTCSVSPFSATGHHLANIEKSFARNGRKVLKEPQRPISLRNDYMCERKTHLILFPGGGTQSPCAYTIENEDACALFTVTGRKHSPRSCREVRDRSGLPLFEIHHRGLLMRSACNITLPGCNISPMATFRRKSLGGNLVLSVETITAAGSQGLDERGITVDIVKHGRVLALFDVVDGDRRIMEVRESIRHNKTLALTPRSRPGYRPAMDMTMMPGVDMSLVSSFKSRYPYSY